ncbi:hypothetical protein CHGG_09212 [Chaetomium globosum CBS 148.51]|uniref:RWD domain-containing protein n=1 Tax=Chaetomium globosum (strain ATCC 6205 / CBS 148.51 / DSM 1962 / NBRC 6347 / NRRL 1970) TaxID=306901 RepID=Q2GS42_CHAGB|nr:uncharacterized protein CHGG_09212 [Chaetomium globosum CBS 148.51]EAQ85198.1 hypothetical protein CHGG_09212 [Chaetomium globosum CBS 148.51]
MMPIRSRGGVWPGSSRQAVTETPPSRVVSKPVPERETKDARGYQIEQLKRRYSPQENDIGHGMVSLLFHLTPSDPDFPFDLNHLECDLRIPEGYPKHPPQLLIKNKDIPRGFVINIERGWDALVQQKRGATLLTLVKALDRRLESLLSEKKAETVKLTIFKDTRHLDSGPASVSGSQPVKPITKPTVDRPYIPEESYSKDQIAEAKARRAQDVRQLEARMHRSPDYQKSSDGVVYTLSLEPKRRASLPPSLQPVQSVQLIVPLLYPLQPLRILLNDVGSEDAEPVEELFAQKAAEQKQMSLTSHLNYLAQNMDRLAKQAQKAPAEVAPAVEVPASAVQEAEKAGEAEEAAQTPFKETGKGHVHVIPRPVEWADYGTGSSESDDDSDDDDEDGGAVIEAEPAGPSLPTQTAELGTAMSFPSIELYGIELLQVSVLNLSVKCDRCKTINETTGLKDNLEKASSCKKCATPFAVRFRQELVHQHSTRAGFIDVTGCTVADLLPNTFTPTCATCSTTSPTGLTSVRGETTTNVCRTCHARFTFALPDVRFLAYAPGSQSLPPTTGPRRRQERLGLHAGEPLPARGAAFCGRSVIGKRGNGYWEGGKGTRDQRLMRRGDKRKYRRLGTAKKED